MDFVRIAVILFLTSDSLLETFCDRTVGLRLDWTLGPCNLQIYESCEKTQVRFFLHTKKEENLLLEPQDLKLPVGVFDPSLPIKVLIHGYAGNLDINTTSILRKVYLTQGSSNVIVVDWEPLSNHPCYFTAVFNVWQVGKCTAEMLVALATKFPFNLTRVHVIGFSLGAHVAGITSNIVQTSIGSRLGRITGLDPGLPLFATLNNEWKLDSQDADFVDAVHTNAGMFGKIETIGHADFFINGGSYQPACSEHRNPPLCSHLLAPVYFAESVNTELGFWGAPCSSIWYLLMGWCSETNVPDENKVLMGEHCSRDTRGIFYLETSDSPPYARGKKNGMREGYAHSNSNKIGSSYSRVNCF